MLLLPKTTDQMLHSKVAQKSKYVFFYTFYRTFYSGMNIKVTLSPHRQLQKEQPVNRDVITLLEVCVPFFPGCNRYTILLGVEDTCSPVIPTPNSYILKDLRAPRNNHCMWLGSRYSTHLKGRILATARMKESNGINTQTTSERYVYFLSYRVFPLQV